MAIHVGLFRKIQLNAWYVYVVPFKVKYKIEVAYRNLLNYFLANFEIFGFGRDNLE